METDALSRPLLFPCADRVKVPQFGSEETNVKSHFTFLSQSLPPTRTKDAQGKIHEDYVKKISTDLLFSEAVVRKHAAHTLPYNKAELMGSFSAKGIIKSKPVKKIGVVGRHNERGNEKKHAPCHIKTISEHKLKPLRRKKKLIPDRDDEIVSEVGTVLKGKETFLTQSAEIEHDDGEKEIKAVWQQGSKVRPKETENWDSHVLMNLSKATARWIVNERTPVGPQRDRLTKLLVEKYGETSQHDTLIRDDASVSEMGTAEVLEQRAASRSSKQQRKGAERGKSDGTRESKEGDGEETSSDDEYDVNNQPLASFYRLPGGVKNKQRKLAIDSLGANNRTAQDIQVFRRKPKPPATLKDVMNPAIGDKMLETDNQFQQEWLLGAQVIHQPATGSQLLLDSGNVYQVDTQTGFPQDPASWHTERKKGKKKQQKMPEQTQMPHQGYKKWTKLPEPLREELMDIHEAGYDPEAHREVDPSTLKRHKENPSLVQLVDDWRTKWHLGSKWYDSSINDLERDMNDINEHVRLQAIATIARAATFRPPDEPGSVPLSGTPKSKLAGLFNKVEKDVNSHGVLPAKLLTCVQKALFDPSHRVCVTAAIALYTLNRPNEEPPYEQARKLLKGVIKDGRGPERWAAAQCLAHAGVSDSFVVGELVKQLFDSENMVKHEQCMRLLTNLSRSSTIVHSMIAEQLNSTSWRHRIIACRALPRLYGTINKDITHKLSTLMWNDWHKEVRKTAAQTLGRTGHGKDVHDELRDRLLNGSERDRIDALHKIGHLGIMTARLLPSYLKCFDDAYIAVRIATTETASKLGLKEASVLKKLLFLTEFDSNWKVKAHALKALGDIGESNKHIESAVMWALRFESEAGVRAEACRTMMKLGLKDPEIPPMLQEKLLVEPDMIVREQLALALESFGVSATGDMEMVQQIKDEVRRLCTRYNIAAKIALNEEREELAQQHKRFFDASPAPSDLVKSEVCYRSASPTRPSTRPSTKHSTRTVTPSIQISVDDDEDVTLSAETPDMDLPKTPGSAAATDLNGERLGSASNRLTPGITMTPTTGMGRNTSAGRRTPEDKLNKLTEVFEGSATLKEYQEYVRPGEQDGEIVGRKLSNIPEAPVEEVTGSDRKPSRNARSRNNVPSSDVSASRLGETVIENVDVPMNGEVFIPYPPMQRHKGSSKQADGDNGGDINDDIGSEMDDDLGDDEEEELKKSILRPTPEPDAISQTTVQTSGDE